MKGLKKKMAALTAAALCLTSMPLDGVQIVSAATSIDSTVKLKPTEASIFNDTNGDGLGEFEGWGTSLCWWANRIGYSDKLTEEAAKLFFSPEGLDMNIGRYNVGGGDDTGETTTEKVPVNEKAKFYDLTAGTYSYAGSSGKAETYSKMADMTYSKSDADFGFTKGEKVGSFTKLGWINKLSDTAGSGDNLKYQVNVDESGAYTVKILMTLEGTNSRDVALGVTAGSTTAQSVVQEEQPALILLDIMLPGIDGFEVCRRIRATGSKMGIIMLTAKSQEIDKVTGLMTGADDYVTKPFSPAELTARVDALIRRLGVDEEEKNSVEIVSGPFVLNVRNRTLEKNGQRLKLTQIEYLLMKLFMENPGKAMSREDILSAVWGSEFGGELKTVDVNIRRLRIKIESDPTEPEYLTTVWGYGYKWGY